MYLLDTNVCIGIAKGHPGILLKQAEQDPSDLSICAVTKAELFCGAYKSFNLVDNLAGLVRFFATMRSFPFDDLAAEEYGRIRAELELAGTPIGPYDLQIAAIGRLHGLTIVTRNVREFVRVRGLRIENWEE